MEVAEPRASDPALNRRDRLLIFVLTFACCAMAASSWWYYVTEAHANEAAAARTIFAVSEGKVRQIWNWRRERIGDGEVILSASTISRASQVLTGGPDVENAEREKDLLRQVLQRLSHAFLYSDAALVDREGNLRLHLNDSGADDAQFTRERRAELAHEANAANDVVLSDLTTRTRSGQPLMSVTVPVRGQGAIILEIDPARFLYPLIAAWPGGGQSAENLLVRVENSQVIDLGQRRFSPGATPLSRRPLNLRLPSPAELDAGWNIKGRDYRSVLVLATIRHIPDSPWYLVSKIDASEVAAPVRRLAWAAALLTPLIALLNAAGGVLIMRRSRERWHREREALFYSIANETPAYLWMESPASEGCFLNQPLREFLRSGPSDEPDSWLDRLHPDDRDRVTAAHKRAQLLLRGYTAEARIRALGGEYRTVVIDALPQFSGGGFSGFAGTLSDVTDRRHAEEQLQVANVNLQSELADRIRREEEIRNLGARLIEAREEERKRLARELHDGLNQQIAAVSIAIGNLKRAIGPEHVQARNEADRIHQRLIDVSESVRAISHELHPALLSFRGLGGAVRSVCDEFASANPLVEVSANISGSFEDVPPPVGLCVYRVLQEALRNVAKHSHADRVRVEMTRSCRTLDLTISDSGIGFEASASAPRTGLGLISIEERVRLVGGALTIASTPGHGTTLTATIPPEEQPSD